MTEPYECWAWLVREDDGVEGVVGAVVFPGVGVMPLQARTEQRARALERYATHHGELSGKPVRLAHLKEVT